SDKSITASQTTKTGVAKFPASSFNADLHLTFELQYLSIVRVHGLGAEMTFLSRMRLFYQISLIGAVALVIFVVVGVVQFVAEQQRQTAQMVSEAALDDKLVADQISRDFLNARRREKDFLLRLDE
ncbi:MAG: hypothetical protein RLN85_05585, partial [Pseudomonadales bacterium]